MWIALIIFFLFIAIVGSKPVANKNTVPVTRKEIDFNLKEYPNQYTFSVSGVHLQDYIHPVLNVCKELDLITLVPEPDNRFDSDAIKVEDSGWHIGYVPAGETYEVHEIIKKDHIAYIESRSIGGYISVKVKIRYKD
jgi:putative lipoic acid-binding regulatory protein